MIDVLLDLWNNSGIAQLFIGDGWKNGIMILAAFVLFYLAIKKEFEPLLLLPIAFGMLLTNLPWPGGGIFHPEWFNGEINWAALGGGFVDSAGNHIEPGLFDFLYVVATIPSTILYSRLLSRSMAWMASGYTWFSL